MDVPPKMMTARSVTLLEHKQKITEVRLRLFPAVNALFLGGVLKMSQNCDSLGVKRSRNWPPSPGVNRANRPRLEPAELAGLPHKAGWQLTVLHHNRNFRGAPPQRRHSGARPQA